MSVTWDMIVQVSVCECAVAALCAATYIIIIIVFMHGYSITLYAIR